MTLTQHMKIILPLGGAIVFAGVAGYLYYKLFEKDEELAKIENSKDSPVISFSKAEIKIPKKSIGLIIGRQGTNIKQIEEKTSTSIHFTDENQNEKTCIIKGSLMEKVEKAKELIVEAMNNIPKFESFELPVPTSSVGRIIGRGGEVIKSIRMTSGAKISVVDNSVGDSFDDMSESTRKILIKGTLEQIEAAKLKILEKVEQDRCMRDQIKDSVSHISQRSKMHHQPNGNISHIQDSPLQTQTPSFPVTGSSKSYSEVFVSAVESPTHFWVQIVGPKTVELDKLVSEMTKYYEDADNQELHTLDEMKPGDLVAAKFSIDDMWYRGRISEPDSEDDIDGKLCVYFVDFGDTDAVDVKNIYDLRTDFLRLGFQAIECLLANIDPMSVTSTKALDVFESLTHATQWKAVMVRVLGYKQVGKDVLPCLRVVNTNSSEDVDIAEELVKMGLANWSEDKFNSLSSSQTSLLELQ